MLAPAPGDRLGLRDFRLYRSEARAFVRPVAERLAFGPPTGAPPILSRLRLLYDWELLEYDWFTHRFI